ncbi:MAG: hypothetical protein LBM71_03450 [Elusimicrobiota bacterium]|jgi:hypothetical protein|nr:hypothetical protein [Elusimicrobiota bacterium]
MKKLLVMTLAVVFASSLAVAHGPAKGKGPKMQNGPTQEQRDEMRANFKAMQDLVSQYKAETDATKKADIEKQVEAKVAQNYDRHLQRMDERIKDSEKRLKDAKAKLAASKKKSAKEKHIQEVTQKILSGQKPMLMNPPDKNFKGHKQGKCKCDAKGKDCPCKKDKKQDGEKKQEAAKTPAPTAK